MFCRSITMQSCQLLQELVCNGFKSGDGSIDSCQDSLLHKCQLGRVLAPGVLQSAFSIHCRLDTRIALASAGLLWTWIII